MAILEDASSPARVVGSGATLVTAAFTPPSNCILAAFMFGDANNGSLDETLTPTDSASGTWSTPILDNARGGAAAAVSYRIIGASPGSMTVTLTDNKGSVAKGLNVRVLTGTDLINPVGASTTAGTASISVVSTVANSWVWSAYLGSNATVTAGTNTTMQDEFGGFDSGDAIATFNSTNTTASAGTTITLVEVGGTAVHHVAVEFVPPNTASIPFNPQRVGQPRDPGETWWIQRDLRDANTVATAANVLPAPLDTAWQAGGPYSHLYTDTAVRDRRAYFQQRPYISDPSLLTPTSAVQYSPPRPGFQRDAGEVQWAQLRTYDPQLLVTAELEGNLLGGAETAKRALAAATNAARWWMPEQPKRDATTPGLLDAALLEGPVLDSRRSGHPALYVDRRAMPPQQRPYLSDPSFYPTTNPTDPLTLAWGAGGTYWLIYNLPAVDVDRREVPQQRRYASDPALLASALLENELLGGAEAVKRHLAAYSGQRFTVPPVLRYLLLQAGPADPTQLTGDLIRRYLVAATHQDRRRAGQQPARLTPYVTLPGQLFSGQLTSTSSAPRTSTSSATGALSSTSSTATLTSSSGGDQ